MQYPEGAISVKFHEVIEYDEWPGTTQYPSPKKGLYTTDRAGQEIFVTPHDNLLKATSTDQLFAAIRSEKLHQELSEVYGEMLEQAEQDALEKLTELGLLSEPGELPPDDEQSFFAFEMVISASQMLLMGTAMREAVKGQGDLVTLSTGEWIEAAFEQKDHGPGGRGYPKDRYFEGASGIDGRELQLATIACVAGAMVVAPTFHQEQEIYWRDTILTLQTHPGSAS